MVNYSTSINKTNIHLSPKEPFKLSLDERWLFILLMLVELLTITVLTFFRWEVIVCFVDIGRIVDHHCLNFL
jgi:hypothetical protein